MDVMYIDVSNNLENLSFRKIIYWRQLK